MTQHLLPDDLPAKKLHVYVAFFAVSCLTILLYWLDIKVVDEISREIARQPVGESEWSRQLSIVRAVLENLIAGAWGALLLALAFRWIVAFIDPRERVIEISPTNIGSRLKGNAQRTVGYTFIGNTASYVAASILPILVESARVTRTTRVINLYIIDPRDSLAVSCYAAFKTEVSRARVTVASQEIATWIRPTVPPAPETMEGVMSKLLAAIYLAAYASIQTQVQVKIHLRRSFTPFRADMSDSEVVLTQESSAEPAVAFAQRGVFYKWYHKEAAALDTQTTLLDFNDARALMLQMNLAHPTDTLAAVRASIITLLNNFPYIAPLAANSQIVDMAADRVVNLQHPY